MAEDDKEAARWATFTSFLSSDDEADRKPAAPPLDEFAGARPSASFLVPTLAGSSRQPSGRRSIYPPVDIGSLGPAAPSAGSAGSLAGLGPPSRIKPELTAGRSTSAIATPAGHRLPIKPKQHEEDEDEIEIIGESSRAGRSSSTSQAQDAAAAADHRARRTTKVEGTRAGNDLEIMEVGPDQPVTGPSRTSGGGDFRQSQAERQKAFGKLAALDSEVRSGPLRSCHCSR